MPLTSGHFKLPLILSTVNEMILSKDGDQLIMTAITYSYTTLHSVAYLAGILMSLSSQMPCRGGEAEFERALMGAFVDRRGETEQRAQKAPHLLCAMCR